MADAWIDHAVEQIDQEVHRNDDGGDQEDAALDDRIITRLHAMG